MTFLAPMAGIIGAVIAIPALLLLYFLKLRRRPLRVSSVLLWEQAAQDLQVNVPLRMIRWSWVLLLQLIALACLLTALARPAVGEGGSAGSRVVIIIDCSASMSATDGGAARAGAPPRTRLDVAKERAQELVDSMGRGGGWNTGRARGTIVAMSGEARTLTRFSSNLGELRDAIESIQPTDQPEDLPAALQLVEAMTADAGEDDGAEAPTVYLVGDGGYVDLSPQDRRGVRARLIYAGPRRSALSDPRADNLGIVAISARRDPDDAGLVRVFARVQNSGAADATIAARCTLDGRVADGGIRSAVAPAATRDGGEFTPGEASLVFAIRQAITGEAQTIVVSVNRSDLLAADDAAAIVLPPVWRPRVLVVAPVRGGEEPSGAEPLADVFLLQALEATEPAIVRVMSEAEYAAATASAALASNAGALAPWRGFDLVVFDRVVPKELPRVATLSFGIPLPIEGFGVRQATAPNTAARAVSWQRNHAALRYVGLDTLLVAPSVSFHIPAESAADAAGETARFVEIVDGTAGPLIVEIEHGRAPGRILRRIAAAFSLDRSNWGPDVSFPVFIGNAVELLTQTDEQSRGMAWSVSTGERVRVSAPAGARSITAQGAAEREFALPASREGADEATGLIGPFDRVGVYRLGASVAGGVEPPVVPVNLLSERESLIAARPEARLGPMAASTETAATEGGPREVWHWFVLAALGLLTIEWFVYAWRMRA